MLVNNVQKWVAMKPLKADLRKGFAEIRFLQHLAKYRTASKSEKFIADIVDGFVHEVVNGKHQCLVLELLGPILDNTSKTYSAMMTNLSPTISWESLKNFSAPGTQSSGWHCPRW